MVGYRHLHFSLINFWLSRPEIRAYYIVLNYPVNGHLFLIYFLKTLGGRMVPRSPTGAAVNFSDCRL